MNTAEVPGLSAVESRDPAAPPAPLALRIPWRIEEGIVVIALVAMVVLPLVQKGVNLLNQHVLETPLVGIVNASSMVQYGTLIVGMIGGAIAARRNRLLSLATTSMLPAGAVQRVSRVLAATVGSIVAFFLALASYQFIQLIGWEFPEELAYGVNKWVIQAIMPIGFGLIAFRQLWHAADGWRGRAVAAGSALLVSAALVWLFNPSTAMVWALMILLLVATVLGTPIFATLGGAALLLLWQSDVPLSSLAISHHSMVVNPTLPTIPLFTLAGYLLAESGASQRLVRVCLALFGSLRGGPAVVTIIVCAFFTSFTGASGVTILALGGLLFPVLVSAGYREQTALGMVTGSGALGMLFAPCLPLILYSIIASQQVQANPMLAMGRTVSIEGMFLAALIPGVLLVIMTAALGIVMAPRKSEVKRSAFHGREAVSSLWAAKWELLTPLVALVPILSGLTDTVEAAALTAAYVLITQTLISRDLRLFRDVPRVMLECSLVVGGVLLILGVAQGFTTYLIDAQVPDKAIEWTVRSVSSPLVFLLLLNLLLLVVGCLMDVYSATIVVVPLIIPIAANYQIDPLHLGVIFLANLELGFLTPPVGMNLFLASYRFNKPVMQIARAVVPFLLIQLIGVLLITYVPPLSTLLPDWYEGHRTTETSIELPPQ